MGYAHQQTFRCQLPVVHLDVLYWRPGRKKESDKASFRVRVADAIVDDGWVVDGSYSGLAFDLTLACADTLIVISARVFLISGSTLPLGR
jgi:hypothetical protein